MNRFSEEMLETREGDKTDQEGHEDHPENVTFYSDMSWKACRGATRAGFHFRRITLATY